MIHVIYMAAGNSRRFGSNKLLYMLDGKVLYRHTLDRLIELQTEVLETGRSNTDPFDIIVVTQYEEIRKELEDLPVRSVFSLESRLGVSYTVKAGIAAAMSEAAAASDWLMFVVADQPYLSKGSLRTLFAAAQKYGEAMKNDEAAPRTISLRCGQQAGNPCLFHASLIPELLELEGDCGGRRVRKRHRCCYVDIADEKELCDIDTQRVGNAVDSSATD